MKRTILAASLFAGAAMVSPASANLVLFGGTPETAFTELGGQGFGAFPRILTEQNKGFESGSVKPDGSGGTIFTGDAIDNGANKGSTPTIGGVGWNSGANVGIGFNADQQGNAPITLQTLVLSIYNGATSLGSFSLAAPVTFTEDQLDLEPGNGNAFFRFVLDAGQQASFDTIRAMTGSSDFRIGLAASLGCGGTGNPACSTSVFESNDGPDSFVAFRNVGGTPDPQCNVGCAVPGPIAGAGIPGLISACFGMFGLRTWRRRRQQIA